MKMTIHFPQNKCEADASYPFAMKMTIHFPQNKCEADASYPFAMKMTIHFPQNKCEADASYRFITESLKETFVTLKEVPDVPERLGLILTEKLEYSDKYFSDQTKIRKLSRYITH